MSKIVIVKKEAQYRQFLQEVYPELAAVASRIDLTTTPDDIYSIYKMWCYNNGKEV